MAFNPFDPIRKYQKSFWQRPASSAWWFLFSPLVPVTFFKPFWGKWPGRAPVQVLFPSGIGNYRGDLDKWRRHRERASEFMIRAGSIQYSKQEMDDRKRAQEKHLPKKVRSKSKGVVPFRRLPNGFKGAVLEQVLVFWWRSHPDRRSD